MARRRSRKSLALVARKARRNPSRSRRSAGYGMALSRAGSMKLAGIPVLPVAGFGLLGYGLYNSPDVMDTLTRPIVIGGAVAGGLVAYKYGKGWMQKASYVALGAGLGIMLDNYMGE